VASAQALNAAVVAAKVNAMASGAVTVIDMSAAFQSQATGTYNSVPLITSSSSVPKAVKHCHSAT
jgi:hypothetical protein